MKSNGDVPDVAAMVDLLWGLPRVRSRGPRPAHSLEDLLDAAIGIADCEGLEAVSMQRLAQAMKFTKMAVYRYVPGHAELIALMTDRALGGPPKRARTGGWRHQIERWSLALFEVFLKHPWGLQATTGPRVIGRNEAGWVELALGILADTGLTGAERLDVLAVTVGHLRSIAQQAAARDSDIRTLGREANAAYALVLKGRETDFPEFSRAIADPAKQNAGLSFGLGCIFDGVEARMIKREKASAKRRAGKV